VPNISYAWHYKNGLSVQLFRGSSILVSGASGVYCTSTGSMVQEKFGAKDSYYLGMIPEMSTYVANILCGVRARGNIAIRMELPILEDYFYGYMISQTEVSAA